MAQTTISIRMDEELKKNMELTCQELGMNMTTAFTIFAKKMTREHAIPFEVSYDPFFSEPNMSILRQGVAELNAGLGVTIKRINTLLRDIARDPFSGIGKPEPLRGDLSGFWSRRIDDTNRLVYRINNGVIEILSCRGHYN